MLITLWFYQDRPLIISSVNTYKEQIKSNPDMRLVDLKKEIPGIKLDIRYATTNNFTGIVMYPKAKAFARKPIAIALTKIQSQLKKQNLGLKIFDAYRPYDITVKFWQVTPNDKKEFVANPDKGSRHNRGCAVDLTIIDLKTGKELPMPTAYDSFSVEAAANYEQISEELKQNRDFLIKIMEQNGFKVIKNEWWHFDFQGWEKYDLMNIPFSKLN